MQKKSQKESNAGKVVAVAVGVAAVSAVAYLLMGPNGKKNRKDLKAWMVKMKADVAEKMENLKEVSASKYHDIVDEVASKYSKLKNINPADIKAEVLSLKKEWSKIASGNKKKTSSKKSAIVKKTLRKGSKK